jgi:hypothetical protein
MVVKGGHAMKKLFLILILIFCFSSLALARLVVDPNSGNVYDTSGNTTYGSNPNTGSNWNTTYQGGGNMQGTDSRGNNWDYNRNTGVYQNYGTGETRYHGKKY